MSLATALARARRAARLGVCMLTLPLGGGRPSRTAACERRLLAAYHGVWMLVCAATIAPNGISTV